MSVVRNSKFRHVFGAFVKRENCYDNIRVSKSSLDSLACAVNPKFLAIIVESGGGAFIVLPLKNYGRVAADAPVVDGHKGYITDIAWCPHDDCVIASASDDCTVKVWQIPETGLHSTMNTPVVDLIYHQRRVNLVAWHPSANNVLLSAASDNKVAVWNVGTGEVLQALDCHPDIVFSASWSWDGSRLVTTCKDKKIRIIEPRSGQVLEEAVCHEGTKATRAIFLKSGQIFTTGFSKMSEWQYSLREPGKLAEPICLQSNDSTNGIIFPLYDPDTNMVYLCGKGDSLIRYFEITSEAPFVHFISIFTTPDPQRGIGMMPKRGCDVKSCEVASFYRLNAAGHCQVVSMKCPRKSELFQEDLFPDTQSDEPAISADDWISGVDAEPVLVSLRFGAAPHLLHSEHQPNVLNRMRSSSFVDIPQARERARREEVDELLPIRNSSYGNRPSTEPAPLIPPRSQTANVPEPKSPSERSNTNTVAPTSSPKSTGAVPKRSDAHVVDVIYKEKRPAIVVSGAGAAQTWRSKGIVGMVAQLKHMPSGSALSQLKVVFDVAENFSSEAQGLLYDELASACEELHPDVSDELRNIILQAFEETYVVNLGDADSQGRVCFEIIRSDSPLAVPFAGIRADGRQLTMFAQLRLIHRMLAIHDALEDVSALLACAVVLPDVDVADFVVLGASKRREVVDSYFSCINYFRELVNGFSRDRDSKSIVVQRLEQIIEMSKTLATFLAITHNYSPPPCQFFHAAKAPAVKRPKTKGKGKGKGKGKKGKNKDDNDHSEDDEDDPKDKTGKGDDDNSDDDFVSKTKVSADLGLYREFFRDLDMNVFVILNCPLRKDNEEMEGISITGEIMKFLLSDYVLKLESMFVVRAPSPFRKVQAPATVVETTRSAKYCIKLVALLRFQLDAVLDYTKNLLAECEGVHDAHGMFREGSGEIKECTTLLLRCLQVLMSWPGFQYSQNSGLRDDLLARLNKKRGASDSDGDNVAEAFDTFVTMADGIVHLPGAVALLRLLKELNAFKPTPRRTKTINQISKSFLRRSWFNLAGDDERSSPRYNENVEALLAFYAQSLPEENRLKHVTELVKAVETEQEDMGRGDSLPSFPNVHKENFHLMYKILCEALTEILKLAKKISDWARVAEALASMTAIMQHLKNWKNLKHYTKLCNSFLIELVKKGKGMDILEKTPSEAAGVLKTIQVTTRYLNRVINDAKAKKDTGLSSYIPTLRKNNERLIMRVKAMCAACPEAFSSGNLRNKNLAGEEIFSQEMEDFDTPVFEGADSDIDDDVAENNDNDGDATDSDISTTI